MKSDTSIENRNSVFDEDNTEFDDSQPTFEREMTNMPEISHEDDDVNNQEKHSC